MFLFAVGSPPPSSFQKSKSPIRPYLPRLMPRFVLVATVKEFKLDTVAPVLIKIEKKLRNINAMSDILI